MGYADQKDLEGLNKVLAPGPNILKVRPSTSSIRELGKATVTFRNSDVAEFGTQQERQTTLWVYANLPGLRNREKLVQ